MIYIFDVHYESDHAFAAYLKLESWHTNHILSFRRERIENIAPYESGAFYKRELPLITALLNGVSLHSAYLIIDGYVHLGENRPGLGYYLFQHFDGKVPVIGIA